jgi:hypothetical protein
MRRLKVFAKAFTTVCRPVFMAVFLVSRGHARRLAKPPHPTVSPCLEPPRRGALSRALNALGEGLRRHRRLIQRGQWAIVFVYLVLVAVPVFLPFPGRLAHIWDNLTLLAQLAFWGIRWPFVLLSMILVGVDRGGKPVRQGSCDPALDHLERLALRCVCPDHDLRPDDQRLSISKTSAAHSRRIDSWRDRHRLSLWPLITREGCVWMTTKPVFFGARRAGAGAWEPPCRGIGIAKILKKLHLPPRQGCHPVDVG